MLVPAASTDLGGGRRGSSVVGVEYTTYLRMLPGGERRMLMEQEDLKSMLRDIVTALVAVHRATDGEWHVRDQPAGYTETDRMLRELCQRLGLDIDRM